MNKLTRSNMVFSALLLSIICLSSGTSSRSAQSLFLSTTIQVEPSLINIFLGDMLTINITVIDVSDLAGWEFKLYWLNDKLNGTRIVESPFLRQAGPTYFDIINFTDNYNSTHGLAWVSTVLLGPGPGVHGSGALASISFKTKNINSTNLWLSETILVDSAAGIIPHTCIDGWVLITKVGDLGSPVNYVPTFFVFDGEVDGYDLALFIEAYKGLAPPEAVYLADLGGPVNYVPTFFAYDGKVDGNDLALFIQCYRGQGP